MIDRFIELKVVMSTVYKDELLDFNWDRLTIIRIILMPLKEITMSLQSEKADAHLGVKVIHFLKEMARREPALKSPLRTVLSKWVNGNDMVNGLLNSSGGFYDYVKNHALSTALPVLAPSTDHSTYIASTPLDSFKSFCVRVEEGSFCLFDFLKKLDVTSVDPERPFFTCQTDKKFFQCSLSPANHHRNVFLKKNLAFLKA